MVGVTVHCITIYTSSSFFDILAELRSDVETMLGFSAMAVYQTKVVEDGTVATPEDLKASGTDELETVSNLNELNGPPVDDSSYFYQGYLFWFGLNTEDQDAAAIGTFEVAQEIHRVSFEKSKLWEMAMPLPFSGLLSMADKATASTSTILRMVWLSC